MRIAGREISGSAPPFIIAEMSGNHGGSLERALRIVDAVAESGAEALKLQTYTADTMTLDLDRPDFMISDSGSLWLGRRLHDLYDEAHTPWDWHEPIFRRARDRGLIAFSSPFDASAVEFLEGLDVPCHKIASFEITDLPLIREVAATEKPMIMSTGMATRDEIEIAITVARESGCRELALLRCTSAYPASPASTDLSTISDLREWSGCEVGLSDHTLGIGVAVAAVALGAVIIEKHVIDDDAAPTVDSAFSLRPSGLSALVVESRRAWESVGQVRYGPTDEERPSLRFRRSLFFDADLSAGTVIAPTHLRIVRPAVGLGASEFDRVLGATLARDVLRGDPVREEDLA